MKRNEEHPSGLSFPVGKAGVELRYYDMGDGVTAFSSTRHGGVSLGNYGGFNINGYCGDAPEAVAANRMALCHCLGIEPSRLVCPHQTHGTEVRQIGGEFAALPENVRAMILEGVDAVTTDVPGMCIGVSTADCIPVLLFDREHHAAAAVHAGWRGTVAGIVVKAVDAMRMSFGVNPSKLAAVIGPGISLKNFEVGDEVYEAFAGAGFDMDRIAGKFPPMGEDVAEGEMKFAQRWHIDLWECNRLQLLGAGLNEGNISVAGICTYDNVQDYFSARRLGISSGRIFTGIVL